MEAGGPWSLDFSTSSPSNISQFKDLSIDYEEGDMEDDLEYPCPFCSDDYYDLVDLCGHIDDEHPKETDLGVCPVCETRIGVNMVDHITMQHGSIFKSHYKLKLHKQLSSRRKDSKDEYNMQSALASRSSMAPSSNSVPDSLMSFICNMSSKEESKSDRPSSSSEVSLSEEEESSDNNMPKRAPLSDKDREETASRCEFVQGLMLSLLLDDDL